MALLTRSFVSLFSSCFPYNIGGALSAAGTLPFTFPKQGQNDGKSGRKTLRTKDKENNESEREGQGHGHR